MYLSSKTKNTGTRVKKTKTFANPDNFITKSFLTIQLKKLEDLKVLKPSPDLLNNVKIGQGQLRLIIYTYFVLTYMGMVAILIKWPKSTLF